MHALIIDDDEPSCQLLEKIVARKGGTADWTTNSRTGLEWATTRRYDLFLFDVHMPGLLGTDVATVVKEHNPDAHVILISAFPDADAQAEAHLLHVPLLAKPFRADALHALMAQVLSHG
jgi:DNA-binding NtrC family response regulator